MTFQQPTYLVNQLRLLSLGWVCIADLPWCICHLMDKQLDLCFAYLVKLSSPSTQPIQLIVNFVLVLDEAGLSMEACYP
jgi:hypothetical protein